MAAADNEDVFVFEDAGLLDGIVHGGDRGFDTMVIEGKDSVLAIHSATGPDSGKITLDDEVIRYAGLEPITADGTTTDVIYELTESDDEAVLEFVNGELKLSSSNNSFEETTFQVPTGSLTIKGAGGRDTLEISGAAKLALGSANLEVEFEEITVTADIETTGNVTLLAQDNLSLSEQILAGAPLIPNFANTESSITIDGATIDAGVFTAQAKSDSANIFGEDPDTQYSVGEKVLDFLGGISLFLGLSDVKASADVTITDAEITADTVDIDAVALTEASVKTSTLLVAFSGGFSEPSATVTIDGDTEITTTGIKDSSVDDDTAGDLSINTLASSSMSVSSQQSLLGPVRTGEKVNITVSYGSSDLDSIIDVGQDVEFNVSGNYHQKAEALKDGNSVSASSAAFEDGVLAVALAISISDTLVESNFAGTLTADGEVEILGHSDSKGNDTSASAVSGTPIGAKVAFFIQDQTKDPYKALPGFSELLVRDGIRLATLSPAVLLKESRDLSHLPISQLMFLRILQTMHRSRLTVGR